MINQNGKRCKTFPVFCVLEKHSLFRVTPLSCLDRRFFGKSLAKIAERLVCLRSTLYVADASLGILDRRFLCLRGTFLGAASLGSPAWQKLLSDLNGCRHFCPLMQIKRFPTFRPLMYARRLPPSAQVRMRINFGSTEPKLSNKCCEDERRTSI